MYHAGRYLNPIPTRFLAPIDCSKISSQQHGKKEEETNRDVVIKQLTGNTAAVERKYVGVVTSLSPASSKACSH
jgi:hypothetical protein